MISEAFAGLGLLCHHHGNHFGFSVLNTDPQIPPLKLFSQTPDAPVPDYTVQAHHSHELLC